MWHNQWHSKKQWLTDFHDEMKIETHQVDTDRVAGTVSTYQVDTHREGGRHSALPALLCCPDNRASPSVKRKHSLEKECKTWGNKLARGMFSSQAVAYLIIEDRKCENWGHKNEPVNTYTHIFKIVSF